MPASYDDAATELYRAPHDEFVAERKRLAGELKAAGDKEAAARLAKLHRPPVSVWVVNQLWWHARREVEAMLETAEQLRAGDLGAGPAHRETIAKLRARAAAFLSDAGHGANEATLRRVTTTLSAIAAAGGFAPDEPGMLTSDRDPPGFETMGQAEAAAPAAAHRHAAKPKHGTHAAETDTDEDAAEADAAEADAAETGEAEGEAEAAETDEVEAAETEVTEADETEVTADAKRAKRAKREQAEEQHRRAAEAARERAEAAAEHRRLEQAAAHRKAQRERIEAALRTAHGEVHRLQHDLDKLRSSITAAEERLVRAKDIATDLEAKLAELK
jgi:DNA repair exonuclease SbcCD ATPase subunit